MDRRLFALIIQIRKKCLQTEEKIRSELGLTPGEFNGLLSLEEGEQVLAAAFSERMGLSPSRGSRVISRMLEGGYIHLEQVPDDRRSVHASLTEAGVKMQKRLEDRMTECEKKIKSKLNPQQVHEIQEALVILTQVM